jgi:hypothetical protein
MIPEDQEDCNHTAYVKTCIINISWEDPNKVTLIDERKDNEKED